MGEAVPTGKEAAVDPAPVVVAWDMVEDSDVETAAVVLAVAVWVVAVVVGWVVGLG